MDAVALYFNADQMLESISASVPAASRDSLLDAVQDALGEPADSYRPAVMNMLSQNFSVYCSSEMVQDGLSYVWHSARPLSESWSDELRAQFAEQLRHNYEEAGVSFAEQDAGTITVNGEEQTSGTAAKRLTATLPTTGSLWPCSRGPRARTGALP